MCIIGHITAPSNRSWQLMLLGILLASLLPLLLLPRCLLPPPPRARSPPKNSLTGILPCEYSQLQLRLADLSGNHWHTSPIGGGDLGCDTHSLTLSHPLTPHSADTHKLTHLTLRPAAAAAAAQQNNSTAGSAAAAVRSSPGRPLLQQTEQQQWQHLTHSSSSSSSSGSSALGQQLSSVGVSGVLTAPRCWLRRYCYDEGAFICLQRQHGAAAAAGGGCSSYVYGASDLHVDPLNQCDHGGPHLVGISVMFTLFWAVLLLIWLHHCR